MLTFGRRRTAASPGLDIDTLYRRHAGMVFRRVLRFFPDEAEAEEVMHEVFMRAIEKQDSFQGQSSPTTWLYSVTTRLCLNRLRDRKRRQAKLELNAELPGLRPSKARDQEAVMLLDQLLGQLDEESLAIATYSFVDGMSHAEIARIVGVSRRTIGNRIEELRDTARRAAGIA